MMIDYLARVAETIFKLLKAAGSFRTSLAETVQQQFKGGFGQLVQGSVWLINELCGCINEGKAESSAAKQIKVVFSCINIIQNILSKSKYICPIYEEILLYDYPNQNLLNIITVMKQAQLDLKSL